MKNISVLIPVYNEEERLKIVFEALLKTWPKEYSLKEVIFVDDGSTDNTSRIIKTKKAILAKKLRASVKLVSYAQNHGKGYAVKQGLKNATGDWTLLIDVDMSTPFSELSKLGLQAKVGTHIIVGTRKNRHSTVVVAQPLYRQILGKMFTYLTQLSLNVWVSDFTCGFKLLSKKVVKDIGSSMLVERWGYDAEILYLAKKYGYATKEVPIAWYNDARTKVNLARDIIQSLRDLLSIRRNDMAGRYTRESARDTLNRGVLSWVSEA